MTLANPNHGYDKIINAADKLIVYKYVIRLLASYVLCYDALRWENLVKVIVSKFIDQVIRSSVLFFLTQQNLILVSLIKASFFSGSVQYHSSEIRRVYQ